MRLWLAIGVLTILVSASGCGQSPTPQSLLPSDNIDNATTSRSFIRWNRNWRIWDKRVTAGAQGKTHLHDPRP